MTATRPSHPRRSQAERSAATRTRVLDATVASLLEKGHAATTLAEVQQRAGLARGTLLHHFPTRAALMVAVVEEVAARRLGVLGLRAGAAAGASAHERTDPQADPRTGWDAAVDLVQADLADPVFLAVLELWVAARTDPDLRSVLGPVERRVFATVHATVAGVVGDEDPRVATLVQFTVDLLTGAAMTRLVDPGGSAQARVVERWRRALPVLLGRADADTWL
ncbi:TetR/AcrR family transcriptional regulator [Nocardioides sp. P86]|uniref:TetR/AcrR family transcriptional regulator n=1 Tax=Nocardioides sp. P86 TaxID=2939569 RepID=UPI0020412791|nr:helix-turn-helix domain-containing protein [Nocardioides sp. P86]MCM3515258.1 TetR/AcrR family transcriptional regulator [Nocardioides sp. P86]